jgi:hypothetical protein
MIVDLSAVKNITIFLLCCILINAQSDPSKPNSAFDKLLSDSLRFVWVENETADIFPTPAKVEYLDEYEELFSGNGDDGGIIIATNEVEKKAAAVLNKLISKNNIREFKVTESQLDAFKDIRVIIKFDADNIELRKFGEQAYSIKWDKEKKNIVNISSPSAKGLIFGVASLSQLIIKKNNKVFLRKANVIDYPKFSQRIFNCNPLPGGIEDDLDWMVKYKIECIALHNTDYSWDKIDDCLKNNLQNFYNWQKNYGGVEALLMLNIYKGNHIEISSQKNIEKLLNVIDSAYAKGVTRFMILSDDTPPFHFGKGYVSNSDGDKKKFSTMAESHCFLMNEIIGWSKKKNYDIEFWYCPAFYTYQETFYGDMKLYNNTRWEKDAYEPFMRDLKIIGDNMPAEVLIFWTGPDVCSRVITDEDLNDWARNLSGRKPFLFDNTIFSQFEFTSSTIFTAYENKFPKDFDLKTGGNGIFINGDCTGETSRAATMTANAYMWEGDRYKPNISLINSMIKLYGSNSINVLIKYKEVELELVKTIRRKELQAATEKLWLSIRKTRYITEKNPFDYHLNYNRMKALKMQLQYSAKTYDSADDFKNQCLYLDQKRKKLISEIEKLSFKKLSYSLEKEMIKLPDFLIRE